MRILFAANPAVSHVLPMVPLGWALRAAGHDVIFATCSSVEHVRTAGLPVVDVAPDFDLTEWDERVRRIHPDIEVESAIHAHGMRLAAMNDTLTKGLREILTEWRPEVVVYSEYTIIGAILAEQYGIPSVRQDIEILDSAPILGFVQDLLVSAFGHEEVPEARKPRNRVVTCPPSLGGSSGFAMRPVPFNGGIVWPSWLTRTPSRPRIVVTEGTTDQGDQSGRLGEILAAAPDVDADFVMAASPAVVERYGPLPDNVLLPGWVPLSEALKGSVALLHHGGTGTALNAAYLGVPQMIMPQLIPHHHNAKALAATGAGFKAPDGPIDADVIRHLITDTAIASACDRLREEIMAMPSPTQLVPVIEQLAK
jgi:UDP:flavonoid glycosyltransferase YjiC (YdhE family)